ncbi:MAG: hypothetical protein K2X77_17140 [Candidatus Obscuribacterales bacterium]|jgi:hypothetical protein|nr:hypothetical protein [Candidatus Obscuribacterales bacterium]
MQTLSKPERDLEKNTASNTGNKLSEAVFDDPETFLKVLRDNFYKIPHATSGLITKNDLVAYAGSNNDEIAKAAKVAADHWSDIRDLAKIPLILGHYQNCCFNGNFRADGITQKDLAIGLNLYQDKTNYYIAKNIAKGVGSTALYAALTAAAVGMTISLLEFPSAWVVGGSSIAMTGGLTGYSAYSTVKSYRWIKDLAAKNQQTLDSWPEINRGLTRYR